MSESIFNLINQNLQGIKDDISELRRELRSSSVEDARLLEQHVKNCTWIKYEEAIKKHLTNNQYNTNYYMMSKKGLAAMVGIVSGSLLGIWELLKSMFLK